MDNNLMDFENFDPFAPSGNNLTEDHSKDFHTDPFNNDDWQTALQGIGKDNTNEGKNTFVSTTTIKTSGDTNDDFFDQKFSSFGDNTTTKTTIISIDSASNNKPNIINVSNTTSNSLLNSSRLFVGEGDDFNNNNNNSNNNEDDEEDFEEYDAVPYEASRKYTTNATNNNTTTIKTSSTSVDNTITTTTSINSNKLDDDWMKDVEKIKIENNNANHNGPTDGQMVLDNNNKREEEEDEDIEEYEWNEEDISGKTKFNGNNGRNDMKSKTDKVPQTFTDNYSRNDTSNMMNSSPDHFEDMSFVDSRQPSKKGLSGLKEMEFNDSYQASNHHPHQQHKDKSQADRAQSIIQHYGTASDNICQVCGKRAYEMEKITVDLIPYHKACFRCHCCHKLLSLGNYSVCEGRYYCRADFNKLFVLKGSHNFMPDVPAIKHEVSKQDSYSSDNVNRSDDYVDGGLKQRQPDVVVSSNIYVIEDELPPPSLTRNLKAMFENSQPQHSEQRQQKQQQQQRPQKTQQKQVDRNNQQHDYQQQRQPQQQNMSQNLKKNDDAAYYQDSKYISNQNQQNYEKQNYGQNQQNYGQNQQNYRQTSQQHIQHQDIIENSDSQNDNRFLEELPQSGLTKSLVAKWKGIEDVTTRRSRGRETERSPGLSRRSQSSSRLEVSNRMTTVDQRGDDWEDDEYRGRRHENEERSNRDKNIARNATRTQGRYNEGRNDRRDDGYRNEGRRDDGYRNEGRRDDGYRNEGRRDDGYRNEGRRDDGYRNEGRRDEGYRNEGRRDDGYRNEGRRDDGYRNEGRRDDGYRNEGRRDDGYRNEGRRDDGYRNEGRRDDGYRNEGRMVERRNEDEDEHKKRNFKWQVKEATPLNRPCIVHGDTPRYQPITGELINEKTLLSEISREAEIRRMSGASDDLRKIKRSEEDDYDRSNESDVIKGSYVTEILQEELPDSAAVKDAMQRFRSMEVSSRRMPLPTNQPPASQQRSRYDPHLGPSQAFSPYSRRPTDEGA